MAVDVCSSCEPFIISPRISFSHDLNNQSSEIATTTTVTATATTTTFDFCITSNLAQPIISADELFFNGVLLPTQLNKQPKSTCPTSKIIASENEDLHRKRLKELLCDNDEEQDKSSSRSFWRFMRTTSLNSNSNTKGPKRLFRSLSLKRMLRSNSTDSALDPSCNEAIKVAEKQPSTLTQTPPVHHSCNDHNSSGQFVTRKNSDGGYGRGKKINHVVNIPATYNRNLFGFGSLFCSSKPRNKTK